MKNVLMALALVGLTQFSAEAQSKNDINYKVCRVGNTYQVCSGPYNSVHQPVAQPATNAVSKRMSDDDEDMPFNMGKRGTSTTTYASTKIPAGTADVNYKVCRNGNTYAICSAPYIGQTPAANDDMDANTVAATRSLKMGDTYTHMGYTSKKRSNIKVQDDDDMRNPYLGKDSRQNDGVQKNIQRNLNYGNGSLPKPPLDGGNSNR